MGIWDAVALTFFVHKYRMNTTYGFENQKNACIFEKGRVLSHKFDSSPHSCFCNRELKQNEERGCNDWKQSDGDSILIC